MTGCGNSTTGHPEAQRAEGSHEILRHFVPQDEPQVEKLPRGSNKF